MPKFVASIRVYFDAPSQQSADAFAEELAVAVVLASEAITTVVNSGATEES
jgi:hypothetical protein